MTIKHSYMVITTNFELEPVLEMYVQQYPKIGFDSYHVVFKSENEHGDGGAAYIVVFSVSTIKGKRPEFGEFLKSYCTLNTKRAVATTISSVFPKLDNSTRGYVFDATQR
jgi:hypothetical protein